MKIAIDVTTLLDQYSDRGIGTYTKNLLNELLKNSNHEWHLIGFLNRKINLDIIDKELNSNKKIHFHSIGPIKNSSISNLFHSKRTIKPTLKVINPDIYFVPNFERGIFKGAWKNVVMLHDIIPYVTNNYSSKGFIHNYLKGLFYKIQLKKAIKADFITTTSNFTKSEIVKNLSCNENKIYITYQSANERFKSYSPDNKYSVSLLDTYNIRNEYLLYYGGLEKNKNINLLIESFKFVVQKFPKLKLIIISNNFKQKFSGSAIPLTNEAKDLVSLVKKLRLVQNVDFRGSVEASHLPLFLANAKAFIHLSSYEGFGLSVLEAISTGTPTFVSDIAVYRELFEGAAFFTKLSNPKLISSNLIKFIEDKELQKDLIENSSKIANNFCWEETAKQTLNVFSNHNVELDEAEKQLGISSNNITFLSPFFYPFKGGAENYSLNIAKYLARQNFNIQVLTSKFKSKQRNYENHRGIKIKRFATVINLYYARFYPGLLFGLLRSRATSFHVQGFGFLWQDVCLLIKKFTTRRKISFINTPHGPFMARKNYSQISKKIRSIYISIQKLYLNWLYDTVLTVNPGQANWIHKEYGIDIDKIKYLPIGIEGNHFDPVDKKILTSLTNEFSIKSDTTVVSYLGRFHKYKGVMDLLESVKMLSNEINNFKVFLIGSDSGELKNMKKFIIENNLENLVHIVEKPSDSLRNCILELSSIFVFPSEWEAYGIAMVEAMAHKNAIISSKTEGGIHLINNKENGILFNNGDVYELKAALIQLISNTSMRNKMIKNNFNKAKSLTWENLLPEYNQIYR